MKLMKINIEEDNSIIETDNSIISTIKPEQKTKIVKFKDGKPDFNVIESNLHGFKINIIGNVTVFFYWKGKPVFMIGPDCN